MDSQEVAKIEQLNLAKLLPYVNWITDVVKASENLWNDAVAKKPYEEPNVLQKELDSIPFDAPIETKNALLMEIERIGLELAPAFLDKKLKVTPSKAQLQVYIEMGALDKGTEKVLHKIHHYLHKDPKLEVPTIPIPLSNLVAMRGMMVRDYGSIRNLLWTMGKHDSNTPHLDRLLELFDEDDPPIPVMAYELKTHKLIKGDFFKWAENFINTISQTTPLSQQP